MVARFVKGGQLKRVPAWVYLLFAVLLFVLVCLLMGHAEWIFSVLAQNTFSDLTGETPRMLAVEYCDVILDTPGLSQTARDEIVVNMAQAMLPQIPAAFLFSNIDSFITDRIKKDSWIEKIVCFIAAYVLQALIAVSCVAPVTWTDAVLNCTKVVISIWLIGGVIYFVFNILSGNANIGSLVNEVVSVIMAMIYPIGKEMVKLAFLTTLFSGSLYIVNRILEAVSLESILTISPALLIIYYVALNRLLDKAASAISDKLIRLASAQTDIVYRKFFIGELFCFIVCVLVITSAISLSV